MSLIPPLDIQVAPLGKQQVKLVASVALWKTNWTEMYVKINLHALGVIPAF